MTTPRKSAKSNAVENSFSEEEDFSTFANETGKKIVPFDDEDEFDVPLDDLDGLENFDADDDDDY
jgi:nitrous oxide reductase accessory protein NosL